MVFGCEESAVWGKSAMVGLLEASFCLKAERDCFCKMKQAMQSSFEECDFNVNVSQPIQKSKAERYLDRNAMECLHFCCAGASRATQRLHFAGALRGKDCFQHLPAICLSEQNLVSGCFGNFCDYFLRTIYIIYISNLLASDWRLP